MTLGFSQEIKGVKNFFVSKIWMGLDIQNKQSMYDYFFDTHVYTFNKPVDIPDEPIKPKLHTIRSGNRWRAGLDIHMVINNRTSNRFQFAPTIKCKSVQKIEFKWYESTEMQMPSLVGHVYNARPNVFCYVTIDGNQLSHNQFYVLAINDGFDSVEDFFAYFNKDFTGTLIHWTDLKY